MNKFFEIIKKILYLICISSIALMLVIIFFQVISRYLFGYTFDWSEELARFLFVWVVFLGSALIIGDKGHMAVKILPEKLKGTLAGVILQGFIKLCSLYFLLLLIIQGSKMSTMMMFQTSPALGLPMGIVYLIIPVSGALMLLYIVQDVLTFLSKKKRTASSRED